MLNSTKLNTRKTSRTENFYVYEYTDPTTGETVQTKLLPGRDGVTEFWIDELQKADNRIVENNLKNIREELSDEEKAEREKYLDQNPYAPESTNYVMSLDEEFTQGDGESATFMNLIADPNGEKDFCYSVSDDVQKVRDILITLPEDMQTLFVLVYRDELTVREAGKKMGKSKTTISEMNQKLKEIIKSKF